MENTRKNDNPYPNGSPYGFLAAAVTVFGLSLLYNQVVDRLERSGQLDGIKAILVIIGGSYTLLASAFFIGWRNALKVLAIFYIALAPMVRGDIGRFVEFKDRAERALLGEEDDAK